MEETQKTPAVDKDKIIADLTKERDEAMDLVEETTKSLKTAKLPQTLEIDGKKYLVTTPNIFYNGEKTPIEKAPKEVQKGFIGAGLEEIV